MTMRRNPELGDFLRVRRAAVSPLAVGVPTYGTQRRVPGLRREEVAQLAGVSVKYYTRIEQGESHQMSDSVTEALANALRLDDVERLHLRRLARPTPVARSAVGPERVRESVLALIEGNTAQAAIVVGRRLDLLGANRLGFALLGLTAEQRPNLAKMIFLEPAVRDLIVDWEYEARNAAASLRVASSHYADDGPLAELIDELSMRSAEFARLWATHPVAECRPNVQDFRHPFVGRMTLNLESMRLPNDPGQLIIFTGAASGSDSADRLRLLDSLADMVPGGTSSPRKSLDNRSR